MNNSLTERKYSGQIRRPKKSILRRWAVTNALFFFIAFAFFAFIIYLITVSSFIGGEKTSMTSATNTIESQLKAASQPLTKDNLKEYFSYNTTQNGETIQMPRAITSMIGSKNQFFIYDTDKQLIFSTAGTTLPFFENTNNEVRTVSVGSYVGYLESRPVVSSRTGKVVAYIQTFYNLKSYYQIQNRLIYSLIGVAALAIVAAIIFGYLMADHFMRPLRRISDSMEKVAANPEEVFQPVQIQQDDEIKQIGDFYNAMMQRITANLEHQKRFVSDVSHELRTPLAVINGNLQMLIRWGFDDKALVEENVRISVEEAARMREMLTDMLDLSRLEILSEEYRQAVSDPAKAAEAITRNFQVIHSDFDIRLENALSESVTAQIAENHYTQALTILMDNAVKYSLGERKTIRLKLASDADFVITQVIDQGVGISKADADHVFERFFRADKARNREIGGTGLGLSILSNILKFYKGEIALDSELGTGTTFTFKIPRAK
jgi:signal transduction histidine kinase